MRTLDFRVQGKRKGLPRETKRNQRKKVEGAAARCFQYAIKIGLKKHDKFRVETSQTNQIGFQVTIYVGKLNRPLPT